MTTLIFSQKCVTQCLIDHARKKNRKQKHTAFGLSNQMSLLGDFFCLSLILLVTFSRLVSGALHVEPNKSTAKLMVNYL